MNTVSSSSTTRSTLENSTSISSKTGRKDSPLSSSSSASSSSRPTNSSSFLSSLLFPSSASNFIPCFSSPTGVVASATELQNSSTVVVGGKIVHQQQNNQGGEEEEEFQLDEEEQENHQSPCNIMRRHCSSMNTSTGHTSSGSGGGGGNSIFPGLEVAADLHDLTSRNHGSNIKSDVSSMYHHHVMQSRQHHQEMHEFLSGGGGGGGSGDPMSGSGLPSLDPSVSVASQLHAPSALYGPHHTHHSNMNGMNTKFQMDESPVHCSYKPFLVNGMISGLHHHAAATAATAAHHQMQSFHHHHPAHHTAHHHPSFSPPLHNPNDPNSLIDADPRELEAFAERFKQRRIKLGVTQADVGRALANLKLPGVGSLSQSTICRFESLTLSHNNMVALKPILQAWLEAAEQQARKNRAGSRGDPLDLINVLPSSDKKRKRTSIAAPEKRSLEAYFAVQPRPSGEKIAAIAEKLDLKKNVVRVWFCNQRQKQKRMKYSAANQPNIG